MEECSAAEAGEHRHLHRLYWKLEVGLSLESFPPLEEVTLESYWLLGEEVTLERSLRLEEVTLESFQNPFVVMVAMECLVVEAPGCLRNQRTVILVAAPPSLGCWTDCSLGPR